MVKIRVNEATKINRKKSTNPLARLSYRELQKEAQKHNFPATLKHKQLLSLLIAHKIGRHDVVNGILKDRDMSRNQNVNPKPETPARQPLGEIDANLPILVVQENVSIEIVDMQENQEFDSIIDLFTQFTD